MPILLALLLAQASVPAAPEPFPYPAEEEKIADEGYQQLRAGEFAKAEATLRRLTDQLAPQNPRAWRLLGFALLQDKMPDSAIRALDKAEELRVDAERLPSLLVARAHAK